jgi:hypothetical protein
MRTHHTRSAALSRARPSLCLALLIAAIGAAVPSPLPPASSLVQQLTQLSAYGPQKLVEAGGPQWLTGPAGTAARAPAPDSHGLADWLLQRAVLGVFAPPGNQNQLEAFPEHQTAAERCWAHVLPGRGGAAPVVLILDAPEHIWIAHALDGCASAHKSHARADREGQLCFQPLRSLPVEEAQVRPGVPSQRHSHSDNRPHRGSS